jgi:DNA-binding MarR family transcriptional regulator
MSHSTIHSHAAAVPPVHRVAAHLARRFHQICLGALSEVTQEEGLTPLEYAALASVDEVPGIDQRRLAARLGIDAVSAGQLVASLEQYGWLERTIDPSDRRARRLLLTNAGAKLRGHLQPLLTRAQDRILSELSASERKQLITLLTRVVESNETYAKPGNGRRAPNKNSQGSK